MGLDQGGVLVVASCVGVDWVGGGEIGLGHRWRPKGWSFEGEVGMVEKV